MLAELIFTLLPVSNEPVYPRAHDGPFVRHKIALDLRSDISKQLSLRLLPYIRGYERFAASGGAEVEIMVEFGNLMAGFYHHSFHSFDRYGMSIEQDGFRVRWKLK